MLIQKYLCGVHFTVPSMMILQAASVMSSRGGDGEGEVQPGKIYGHGEKHSCKLSCGRFLHPDVFEVNLNHIRTCACIEPNAISTSYNAILSPYPPTT
jgi:hypothetical protein